MSIWDNVKKFAQPYSDDEYDDYDDYDDDFEEVEEEPVRRPARKPARPARAPRRMPALERESEPVEDETDEDDYDSAFNSVPKAAPAPVAAPAPAAAPASFPGKVVSMNRVGSQQEIVRFHPNSFQDSRKAAKDLVSSKAVIVNLENLDKDSARRMVDFLSGVVFAMDGDVQKIAQSAYVFCPPNVFITGGPEEIQAVAEEIV